MVMIYGQKDGYDQVLPFFENYYAGGSQWMRGFRSNAVGPRALQLDRSDISGPMVIRKVKLLVVTHWLLLLLN